MKLAWLLVLGALGLFAQNPAQILPTTSNPNGKTCNSQSMRLLTPNGTIYTCQNGHYAAVSGGGGGSPGGSSGQVQYNNSGSFGGITGATTNGTALTLVAPVLGTPASGNASNLTFLPITLTTTGSSGASTYTQATNTLNIPQYAGSAPISGATPTAFVTAASATTLQTPCTGCTLDSGGNALLLSLTTGLGGSVAGYTAFGQGTATSAPANSVGFMAPASVSVPFFMRVPSVPTTGFLLNTGTSDPTTLSIVTAIPNGFTATTQSQNDNSTKPATTAYTDLAVSNALAGTNPAVAVLAASTGAVTGTYSNGAGGIGATFTVTATGTFSLDGVAINTIGQRVLLKNQSSAFQNGVYTATIVGAVAVSPIFTRALDYDMPSDINSTGAVPVQSGTVNATTSWLLTSTVNTVGTDALTYTQFSVSPSTVVIGPASSTANNCAKFADTTGKLLADAGTTCGGGSSVFINSQGLTGSITMTGSAVTVYTIASVPALASGACYQIFWTINMSGADASLALYVDSTSVASLGSTGSSGFFNVQNFMYCNNAGVQNAQTLTFLQKGFAPNAGGAGWTDSTFGTAWIITPTAQDWSMTHTISVKATAGSSTISGSSWRIAQ